MANISYKLFFFLSGESQPAFGRDNYLSVVQLYKQEEKHSLSVCVGIFIPPVNVCYLQWVGRTHLQSCSYEVRRQVGLRQSKPDLSQLAKTNLTRLF